MNESLEPEEVAEVRRPAPAPPAPPIAYDEKLDLDDAAFRYVVKRGTPVSGREPGVDSPPRPGRGGGTL